MNQDLCSECGQTVPYNMLTASKVEKLLTSVMSWWSWSEEMLRQSYQFKNNPGQVMLIDRNVNTAEEQGEGEQPVNLVFAVDTPGERNYYAKHGYGDSYGEITWQGPFKQVFPKQKTVTVYE